MSHEGPLSVYVHEHAGRALQGLMRVEHASEGDLERALSVQTVHDTRTSLRRLRATLRTFPESFTLSASTDRDLRFVARSFSEVRDTDVLSELLLEQVDALPPSLDRGPVREDLGEALSARRRTAVDHVAGRHGSARWRRALAQLDQWQQEPPLLVQQQVLDLLVSAQEEVRRRIHGAGGDPHALHSARKAAKRWRYAAELLLPVEPAAAEHYAAATEVHVQLGQMQDAVIATVFLREHSRVGDLGDNSRSVTELLLQRAQQQIEDIAARALQLI